MGVKAHRTCETARLIPEIRGADSGRQSLVAHNDAMSFEPAAGSVLDAKYLLHDAIGGGRFGTVYRATHIALQKSVAVKVLRGASDLSSRDFEQFRVEAEALGRLAHPHIVGVVDFGVDARGAGIPYLVMDLVEGETMDEVSRRRGAIDLERAAPWLRQIASALDHAHANGVTHGDLTARNVLLVGAGDDADAKVIDFGLARLTEAPPVGVSSTTSDAGRTAALETRISATPEYAAPERVRGEAPTPASDAYAFAVLAYRLLTGRCPFEGEPPSILRAQLTEDAPPPSSLAPALPASVDVAIGGGLAKRPEGRPHVSEMATALETAAGDLSLTRWRRREAPRRVSLALALAGTVVLLAPGLQSLEILQRFEGAALDARTAVMTPEPPDARLLIVSIDDESLERNATPLSGRGDDMAATLERAFSAGASIIALDLLLPEPWAGAPAFGNLVLAHAGRLVLGMASDGVSVVGPEAIDPLVAGTLGPDATSRLFGLVTNAPSADGVIRRGRAAVIDNDGRLRATLAGRVSDLAGTAPAPGPEAREFLINYRVDTTRFERVGWHAFETAVGSGTRFDGRILLVGAEFTGSGDRHRIPRPGQLPSEVTGLTVQAVVTDTLLRGRQLGEARGAGVWLGVGLLLLGTALSLLWLPLIRGLGAAAGIAVLGSAAAVFAFAAGVALPLATPLLLWAVVVGVGLWARSRLPAHPE